MPDVASTWQAISELRQAITDMRTEMVARSDYGMNTRGMVSTHEQVCAERYKAIAEEMRQVRLALRVQTVAVGFLVVAEIFGGKAAVQMLLKTIGVG